MSEGRGLEVYQRLPLRVRNFIWDAGTATDAHEVSNNWLSRHFLRTKRWYALRPLSSANFIEYHVNLVSSEVADFWYCVRCDAISTLQCISIGTHPKKHVRKCPFFRYSCSTFRSIPLGRESISGIYAKWDGKVDKNGREDEKVFVFFGYWSVHKIILWKFCWQLNWRSGILAFILSSPFVRKFHKLKLKCLIN